jgi:MFS family permease
MKPSPLPLLSARAPDDPGLARDLRAMNADGAAFSVMVGLGETYFAAFGLAAGLQDAVVGFLATLPMLAGGVLQLVTPFMVTRLGSCRRWVLLCASGQALSFVPLIAAGWLGRLPTGLLFLCAALYWGCGMATGPAWNVWAETLVPVRQRARFFADRTRLAQGALLGAVLCGGFLLHREEQPASALNTFALLFALAAAARVVSTCCLAAQSERPGLAASLRPQSPWRAWRGLRGSDAERLLQYLLTMQVFVNIASPFFTPYMLGPLGLSYLEYTALTAAAFAARIAVLPLLGRLSHTGGNRTVLWLGAVGITPLPALWLVSDSFGLLLALQLMAGSAWAALELSTLLAYFEDFAPQERASVLSAFNLASALAMSAGTLVGGALLTQLGPTPATYALLFGLSTLGRGLSLALLRRIALPKQPLQSAPLRTMAVRPSLGAVQSPILATLPEASAAARAESAGSEARPPGAPGAPRGGAPGAP